MKGSTGSAAFIPEGSRPTMKRPFSGGPTNGNIGSATTYALYNDDVDPTVTALTYNLEGSGWDVYENTITSFSAPFIVACVGSNYLYIRGDLLESVSCPKLTTVTLYQVVNSPAVTSVLLPLLTTATDQVNIQACNALVTLRMPSLAVSPLIALLDNALSAASVNQILADLVATAWGNAGEVLNMTGGTNAAPSGQGIADKATLIARGATVTTN